MRRFALTLLLVALAACGMPPADGPTRRAPGDIALPPMKTFGAPVVTPPLRANSDMVRDFLDLSFELESGRTLPVLTRFEGPVTVRVLGPAGPTLVPDLERALGRFRREAGIDIRRVEGTRPANITIEVVSRNDLRRTVPQAACFVAPRMTSWAEFRASRRSPKLDWTTLRERETMAVFLPGDVAPQEIRDCLQEELAQALGPLNDLYRLPDSVFNDDNFHTVLTGFDMLMLRATYAPELHSGMTKDEVAARLPAILARLNPRGQKPGTPPKAREPKEWTDAIETALGPDTATSRRQGAAKRAVQIAEQLGWNDVRTGFSLFALGRLSLGLDNNLALASFLSAGQVFRSAPTMRLQDAHVSMQLAAFALSAGQPDVAVDFVNKAIPVVSEAENAALLSTMLMIKAEALDMLGKTAEARTVRLDSLSWGRYGFGSDEEVRLRAAEIAALAPRRAAPQSDGNAGL